MRGGEVGLDRVQWAGLGWAEAVWAGVESTRVVGYGWIG